MANPEHVEILKQGVDVWNKWREDNPKEIPDLSEYKITPANLKNTNVFNKKDKQVELSGINFSGANLNYAKFYLCNLNGAKFFHAALDNASFNKAGLQLATFADASLDSATFENSDLLEAALPNISGRSSKFEGCSLWFADLSNANLTFANFSGAWLWDSNLSGANLFCANFENTDVGAVKFSRNTRQKAFQGIRAATCYGSQRFKTFAQDQDFIEELRASGKWGNFLFWIWWLFANCGRSFWPWACWSAAFAFLFAVIFFYVLGPSRSRLPARPLTPS